MAHVTCLNLFSLSDYLLWMEMHYKHYCCEIVRKKKLSMDEIVNYMVELGVMGKTLLMNNGD